MGRYITLGVLAFFGVLIIALAIPSFIDWNKYRGAIESAASDMVGRDVKIAGPVNFAILPRPALTLGQVSVPRGDNDSALELQQLAGKVEFSPLLRGEVQVSSLVLDGATLTLWGDGTSLSSDISAADLSALDTAEQDSGDWFEGFITALIKDVRVDSLTVSNFEFVQVSSSEEEMRRIKIDDGVASLESLQGPFHAELTVQFGEQRFRTKGETGRLNGDRPTAINLEAFSQAGTSYTFSGTVEGAETRTISGALQIEGQGFDPINELATVMTGGGEGRLVNRDVDLPLSLGGNVTFANDQFSAPDLTFTIGDDRARVGLELATTDGLKGAVSVDAVTFDIDKVLAAGKPLADDEKQETSSNSLPLVLDITAKSEGIVYRDGLFKQVSLSGALVEGSFVAHDLTVTGPGNSTIEIKGGEALAIDAWQGKVSASSQSLRLLLDMWDVDIDHVPANNLGWAKLTSKIKVTPKTISFDALTFDVDKVHGEGTVLVQRGKRRSFGAKLDLDELDLTQYGFEGSSTVWSSVLKETDANLQLTIGRFKGLGLQKERVEFKSVLFKDALDVETLTARVGKNSEFRVSGKVTELSSDRPTGNLSWSTKNWASCPTATRLGLTKLWTCEEIGPLSLKGKMKLAEGVGQTSVSGNIGDVSLNAQVDGAEALWRDGRQVGLKGSASSEVLDVSFEGQADNVGTNPKFDFALDWTSDDASKILNSYGVSYLATNDRQTKFVGKGRASFADEVWTITDLSGSLGEGTYEGGVVWRDIGGTQNFELSMSLDSIAFEPFFSRNRIPGKGQKWSATSFDFDIPKGRDGTFEVDLIDADFGTWQIDKAHVSGVAQDREFVFAVSDGEILGGRWSAQTAMSMGSKDTLTLNVKGKGDGVNLSRLSEKFFKRRPLSGNGSVEFDLSTSGHSPLSAVRGLSGLVSVSAAQGEISGFDYARFSSGLETTSGAMGVQLAVEESLGSGRSPFFDLIGEMTIADGVVRPTTLSADLGSGRLVVDGQLDLPTWSLTGNAAIDLEFDPQLPNAIFEISGGLDSVVGRWNTWALEKEYAARRAAELAATQVVTEEGAASGEEPENSEPFDEELQRLLEESQRVSE